jgi:polyhydroxyalkanoate synthesis repressor PhaR
LSRFFVEVSPHTPPSEARAPRVIKRYSNRKLYDTTDSRYVTLLQVAEMVRGGEEVQIIDNNSKEDLTEVTLAQIIYEEKKARSRSVPLQTLKDLIHQRTEQVWTELRDGPIGRLIPGRASEPPAVDKDKPESTKKPEPPRKADSEPAKAPSLVDQAKEKLEEWQRQIDDRVRAALPGFIPMQHLEDEVKRLGERVTALEEEVARHRDRMDK